MNVTTLAIVWQQADRELVRAIIPGHGTLTIPLNIARRVSDWLALPVDAAPGMLTLDDVHRLTDSIGRVTLWRDFDGTVHASVYRTQPDRRRHPVRTAYELTTNVSAIDVDPFGLLMVTESMRLALIPTT